MNRGLKKPTRSPDDSMDPFRSGRLAVAVGVAVAHALELAVVAEVIEDEAQRAFLVREGCGLGQGFFLGRPAAPERLVAALAQEAGVGGG